MRSIHPKTIDDPSDIGPSAATSTATTQPSAQQLRTAELIDLLQSFNKTGQISYFERAGHLAMTSIESKSELVKFMRATDGPPTEEVAEDALKDLQSMWPQVAGMFTTTVLMQIHQCVRASGIAITFLQLRMFLVNCARSVKQTQQPMADARAAQIAFETKERVLMIGDLASQKPFAQRTTTAEFLDAQADSMEHLVSQIELKRKLQVTRDSMERDTMPDLPDRLRKIVAKCRRDAEELREPDSE